MPSQPLASCNPLALQFNGSLAEQGLWLTITRVTHDDEFLLHASHTGYVMAGCSLSPIDSLSHQTHPHGYRYPLAQHLFDKSWNLSNCHFHMVGLGPLESRTECRDLEYTELCRAANLVTARAARWFSSLSLPYTKRKYRTVKHDIHLESSELLSHVLFAELHDLAVDELDLQIDPNQ